MPVMGRVCRRDMVSVVVINHDNAAYLPAALNRCLAQDSPDVETIVADDCSADGSREVLDRHHCRVPVFELAER